ncbi:MAG: hypothetical protein Fues2KO_47150 [Fuerstiella sp.]
MIRTSVRIVYQFDRLAKAKLKAQARWLGRVGGFIRKVARRSLKRATRVRSEEELTDTQLDRYVALNQWRRRRGLEPADLPERVSKPGRPPLIHDAASPLKRLLLYKVDRDAGDVVIGPERAKKGIVHKLEHGDRQRAPRPFMEPARRKAEPHLAAWWQDAITA